MKIMRLRLGGSVLAAIFLTLSCQVQQDIPETAVERDGAHARLSREAGVLELNYEVETTTTNKVISHGTTKRDATVESIYTSPHFSHSTVRTKILANGAIESEILFDEPIQQSVLAKHKSQPDPSPRMAKAILKGGQLYLYNAAGNLTSTRHVPVDNFKALLQDMKTAKDKVKASRSLAARAIGQPGVDVDAILEMAKSKNGKIRDINPDLKEVELDIDEPNRGDTKGGASAFKMKYKVDTKRNLMLGGELYDRKTAKLLSRTIMAYKHRPETNDDVVSTVYSEDYREDVRTGHREKSVTVCRYKKFEYINNIN